MPTDDYNARLKYMATLKDIARKKYPKNNMGLSGENGYIATVLEFHLQRPDFTFTHGLELLDKIKQNNEEKQY